MDLNSFLERNNLSHADLEASGMTWESLLAIHGDYLTRRGHLEGVAEFVVKAVQAFGDVHSVRWRLKDPEHLLEKIIRKLCEKDPSKKYVNISVENYTSVVTDLVGVRALHLFKDQVFPIHEMIMKTWSCAEKPVSYIREGDHSDLVQQFKDCKINTKIHKAGYRSVHYVLRMKPGLSAILIELQVRTIFEEGWSEIDHKIRYPNFSDNKQIESVLKIFNRLAGSADELGGFIRGLSIELEGIETDALQVKEDRDNALAEMQKLVSELSNVQQINEHSTSKINSLQTELNKMQIALRGPVDSPLMQAFRHSFLGSNDAVHHRSTRKTILGKE